VEAATRQLPPGTMLDDKYRIESLLAVGGMGAVYAGTHTQLRKKVAIKILNPQLDTPAMIARFQREAITASQIGHEGIAQVTDLGTSRDGEAFLVMELLEGDSLSKRLKATGPMPIELAAELGCAILAPLHAAHQAGIVHRDLKPDNVFLVRQSRGELVKLLDFGISRAAGLDAEMRLTNTGVVMGTPFYMSPEQARGDHEVGPASDLYSFGVIVYEMLVGALPITGENYNQLLYRVMTGEYVRARERRPDIPERLDEIIATAMALEPAQRPASAAELEHALLQFCRPVFRDHMIQRISSAGIVFGVTSPFRRSDPVATPLPHGTDPTLLAPSGKVPAPARKKSMLPFVLAAALVVVGVAAAVVASQTGEEGKPQEARTVEMPTVMPVEAEAAAERPAPVQKVTLRFAVEPTDATIVVDGHAVSGGQLVVEPDGDEHVLTVRAPGYKEHTETLKFDESQRVIIKLERAAKAPTPAQIKRAVKPATKRERIEVESPYQ
jgi:serine/threonine protein kinase